MNALTAPTTVKRSVVNLTLGDAEDAALYGVPGSYDPASGTYIDADGPTVFCDTHTARDIDPDSGRCWECGEQVPGLVRA